jgi:hypothetical protein
MVKKCPFGKDCKECRIWVRDADLTDEGECAIKMIAKELRRAGKDKVSTRWP